MAEGDHQAIYKLVAAIEKKKDDAILLNQLADELEKRTRFEERELFNHLQGNKITCMNKILTIVLAMSIMAACNTRNENGKTTTTEPAAENQVEHAEQALGLALNNGVKWKADSLTVLNVDLLQKVITSTKKESLENYSQAVISLQNGLNKMVSECKMKGADHEALHHWLEPVMEKTKELKVANSIETASTIFGEIEKQINLFPQYFE